MHFSMFRNVTSDIEVVKGVWAVVLGPWEGMEGWLEVQMVYGLSGKHAAGPQSDVGRIVKADNVPEDVLVELAKWQLTNV